MVVPGPQNAIGALASLTRSCRSLAAALCLLALIPAGKGQGQSVVAPPPATSVTPPAVQQYQENNQFQVFSPITAPFAGLVAHPLQWGPVTLRPHVLYRFVYGNGFESSPGNQQNTVLQQVSPGMLFELGSHLTLDYTPTLSYYSSKRFQNTLDHAARLTWGTAYEDWFFGASQSYVSSSEPLIETGAQNDRESYATTASASHQLNSKLSMDLGLSQNFDYIGNTGSLTNLSNSRVWSTMDWLNYQFWPRLVVGAGFGFGYINEDAGPDMTYEQYQARINWRATDKISLQLSGGLQDQQFLAGGAGDLVTPIMGATIQYQPFEHTRLSLSADRTVSTSYFENQITENTGVSASLDQRLLGKLYLDLGGGYGHTEYLSSISSSSGAVGFGAGRTDDTYTFNVRLTCPFLKRGTFSVFYQYS
ncbi:MAG: outer membrane beta-barrel protein, partial [Verrucomicrobia bacterium]|nr:outer membrane beta-barrel protein [Verrucomicrobiota bacterium]